MNMRFVDLHCDTLLEMYSKNRDLAELDGHIDLAALRQGGALMQCFAPSCRRMTARSATA